MVGFMTPSIQLLESARQLIQILKRDGQRLVLAESCTAGLVASTVAGIPGASSVLVGSAVVYQVATKQQWLAIPAEHFEKFDVVSGETSEAMARSVLQKTPWATMSASITGHLGPDAPVQLDGIAWATIATQPATGAVKMRTQKLVLDVGEPEDQSPSQLRLIRQQHAAAQLLGLIAEFAETL